MTLIKTIAIPARLMKPKELLTEEEQTELASLGNQEMTPEEEAEHLTLQQLDQEEDRLNTSKNIALQVLAKSDLVIVRCAENDVTVPKEWAEYRTALRTLAKSGEGELPIQPVFPEGT